MTETVEDFELDAKYLNIKRDNGVRKSSAAFRVMA
jgi:hypothetical protein